MRLSILSLQVTGAGLWWPMLPLKASSFGWLRFMCPRALARNAPFFQRFEPFLDDPKRIILVGDWNTILNPKAGWSASWSDMCESSLIDLMAQHDLVDRFRLDHLGKEMWTLLDSSPSVRIRIYLYRVFVRRAGTEFVRCSTFHWIELADQKLVRVSQRLVNGPSLASNWKFNTSTLVIRDFRERLENLIQQMLVGAVTENKWWGSLKYRIREFAIKYSKQLNLAGAKKAKSLDDRLSRAWSRGIPLP